jgi:hypothetical protein
MSSKNVPFQSFKSGLTKDDAFSSPVYIDPEQNINVDLIHMFKGSKQIVHLNHEMSVTFIIFGHKICGMGGLPIPATTCIEVISIYVYVYMYKHIHK